MSALRAPHHADQRSDEQEAAAAGHHTELRLSDASGRRELGGKVGLRHLQRAQRLALAGLVLALTAACAAPIGVKRSSARAVDRALSINILSTDRLSVDTQNLLRGRGLDALYAADPVAAMLLPRIFFSVDLYSKKRVIKRWF